MKIITLPIGDLKPYANNPRRHPPAQINALKKAIVEFGFDQPIVVEPDYTIIKGHGRWEAAKQLGLTEVPVVIKAVTPQEAKMLRVADNEIVSSDWDYHALQQEVDGLSGSGLDLEVTGFTIDELADLPSADLAPTVTSPAVVLPNLTRTCKHCGTKF